MDSQQTASNPKSDNEPQIKVFAYLLAWLSFIASAISIIVIAFKDLKLPEKDDYKK